MLDEHLLGVLAAEGPAGGRLRAEILTVLSDRRSGEAIVLTVPSDGCSCSTIPCRAVVCSSSSASRTELILALGTPAGMSSSSHSSTVRSRKTASRIGSSTSRFSLRAAMVAKRGSSFRSGRPATSQSRSQNFCFAAATTNQPSLAWKFWNGTIDGCAELAMRGGT